VEISGRTFIGISRAAARKLVEIVHTAEAVQDGRIHIELINTAFLTAAARDRKDWICAKVGSREIEGPTDAADAGPDSWLRR